MPTANRVSSDQVKAIIDTDVSDVTPFIDAAHSIVSAKLSSDDLSTDQLDQIEMWLAAHFIAIRDPRIRSEQTEGATVTYFIGHEGLGLDATPYGQQVKILDTSGKLVKLGAKSAKVEIAEVDLGV